MGKYNDGDYFLISKTKKPIRAAVFSAHPDDETIWMGGTILSRNDWIWKIFIATHNENDERGIEFKCAINEYKVKYEIHQLSFEFIEIMEDTQDENRIKIVETNEKLKKIKLDDFDVIFTHNIDGEYNHFNHKILGEYFKNKREDNLNIWHFFCPAIQHPRKKEAGEYIESIFLNPAILTKKTSIFQCAYTSQHFLWTSFEDFMRFQFHSGVEMFTRF